MLGAIVPSDVSDVPSNANSVLPVNDGTGRQRSERLRARRNAAGLAQVSGWVPKERRAYAREVLEALARGANSLPADPEQAAALEALRAEIEATRAAEADARAALTQAEQRGQVLAAELEAVRATEREKAQAKAMDAQASATDATQAQERATAALQRAERAETAIRQARSLPGVRGRLVRWLAGDVLK